jgi:hypothetical protein
MLFFCRKKRAVFNRDLMVEEKACSFSKWRKYQVLLDTAEMKALCEYLSPIYFFNVSQLLPLEKLEVEKDEFLEQYGLYIKGLKKGKAVVAKGLFSAFTVEKDAFNPFFVGDGKYKAKARAPVVQMQPYRFAISSDNTILYSMVMGSKSVDWGIQFSYPQVFHNGSCYVRGGDVQNFPNGRIFTKLVQWLRSESLPITFTIGKKKISTPLRLGKECFLWIKESLRLTDQEISIE